MLPRERDDWQRVLMECGVAAATAAARAPDFAATIGEDTFSAGLAKELPDFLATILHESAMLTHLRENGHYRADRIRSIAVASPPGSRWRSLGPRADELAGDEAKFFEACYGGRMGNGPEGCGDGARYPGRAYIGATGLDNYRWLSEHAGVDLVANPELLEEPVMALRVTVAWWEGKVPDSVLGDERAERRIVNGGYIGIEEVEKLTKLVRGVLQC